MDASPLCLLVPPWPSCKFPSLSSLESKLSTHFHRFNIPNTYLIEVRLLNVVLSSPLSKDRPTAPSTAKMSHLSVSDENQRPGSDRRAAATNTETHGETLAFGLKDLTIDSSAKETKDIVQVDNSASAELGGQRSGAGEFLTEEDQIFARERSVVTQYLLDNVAEFRELSEIRQKVSKLPRSSSRQKTVAKMNNTGLGQSRGRQILRATEISRRQPR